MRISHSQGHPLRSVGKEFAIILGAIGCHTGEHKPGIAFLLVSDSVPEQIHFLLHPLIERLLRGGSFLHHCLNIEFAIAGLERATSGHRSGGMDETGWNLQGILRPRRGACVPRFVIFGTVKVNCAGAKKD